MLTSVRQFFFFDLYKNAFNDWRDIFNYSNDKHLGFL